MSDDHLYDLVIQWDQRRQLGEEITPEVLCKDQPELLPELEARIASVKASDWMFEPDDKDDDFLSLPDFATVINAADETQVPAVTLSIDEFTQAVADSGLMTSEEVEAIQQRSAAKDAQEFCRLLLREKKLTTYQAKRICDGNTKRLVLGNYIILDEIGAGGMGQVFKARHQRMKRVVALKVLPEHAVNSPTALERFHREVEAAAKLEHPNIVTAYDADESDGTHFLVMQYVDGQDLATLVQRQGRLSVSKAVDCIIQAAKGLEFAHGEGVVHRDIKPANLLIDNKGCVKVLDMGLALLETSNGNGSYAATQAHLTQDGTVMGTVDYMSPEQALETHHADARSDMYSLGCTLFYLLTGKPIYGGGTLMAKMLAHREEEIPMLSAERDDIPEKLTTIFRKMVAKKSDERYPTMTALLQEMDALVSEFGDSWQDDESDASASVAVESEVDVRPKETSSSDLDDTFVTAPKINPHPPASPPSKPQRAGNRSRLFAGGLVGLLMVGLIGYWLFGVIFKVQTPDGLIQIETNVTDVEVFVDGQKVVTITDPKDKSKVKVEVKPGAKTLSVSKDGFEAEVSTFTLKTVKGPIKVTFVPKSLPYIGPQDTPAPAIAPFNAEEAKQHQEAWAKHLGVEVETTNSIGMKFRVIPPGEFLMGSSEEEIAKLLAEAKEQNLPDVYSAQFLTESPQHRVTLSKPFGMSIYEVTRGQFRQFVDATGYKTDSEKDGKGGFGYKEDQWVQAPEFLWNTNLGFYTEQTDDHPVVNVSWNDAVAFCEWLSEKEGVIYRLPTEAEWEFACRAGSLARFSFGDEQSLLDVYAWFGMQGGRNTKPVGQKQPNSLGLFDLHGNVWEWCHDNYGPYTTAPAVDPLGSNEGSHRLLRGGSFIIPPSTVRSASRINPTLRDLSAGFRASRTYEKPKPKTTYTWPKNQPAAAKAPFNAEQAKQHQEAWAKHLGTEVETTNSIGMKIRVIPPGEFMMGSSEEEIAKLIASTKGEALLTRFDSEGPQHRVTLTKPFGLAVHEVTRGQFRKFVEATGYKTDAEKDGKGGFGYKGGKFVQAPEFLWNTNLGFETEQTDDHPVVNVTWNDAVAFCEWLSNTEGVTYRLPTEAEWEFACRAGSLARFSFGNEESKLGEYAWYASQSGRNTMPVGKKAANALGLFDLHGNVWEWCHDWHGPYTTAPAVDPLGSNEGSHRLLRGGSFNYHSSTVRSATRVGDQPTSRNTYGGFRPSRTYNLSP